MVDLISKLFLSRLTIVLVLMSLMGSRLTAQSGSATTTPHSLREVTNWLVTKLPQLCSFHGGGSSPNGRVLVELNVNCSAVAFEQSTKTLSFSWRRSLEARDSDGEDIDIPDAWARLGNRSEDVSIILSGIDLGSTKIIESHDIKTASTWVVHLECATGRKAFVINGDKFSSINLKYFRSQDDADRVRRAIIDAATLAGAQTGGYNP